MSLNHGDWASDQRILNATQQGPHESGVMLSVSLPDGETIQAVVEKLDFKGASQWCDYVRSVANEKYDREKSSEEQRARRAQTGESRSNPPVRRGEESEAAVQVDEAPDEGDASYRERLIRDRDSTGRALIELEEQASRLGAQINALGKKMNQINKLLEVLDEDEDDSETS